MTERKEAIKDLKFVRSALNDDSRIARSYDMAISALSAEEDNTMEWIFDENETCSRCGYVVEGDHDIEFKFCPNCGRKAVQNEV